MSLKIQFSYSYVLNQDIRDEEGKLCFLQIILQSFSTENRLWLEINAVSKSVILSTKECVLYCKWTRGDIQ